MNIRLIFYLIWVLAFLFSPEFPVISKEKRAPLQISLPGFIQLVIKNDPNFSLILVNELNLKFQKDLLMPAKDLVLGVTGQYDLFLPLANNGKATPWEGNISLSKLFPKTGTALVAEYRVNLFQNQSGIFSRSGINLSLSQSIVQNAFGIMTRMEEKKIEIDNDIARYQVIEAYEDYLATLIQIYLDWFGVLENLRTSKATFKYNNDLLRSIKRKYLYRIAFREDVYKMELEVLIARENIIDLQNELKTKLVRIYQLTGIRENRIIAPVKPSLDIKKDLETKGNKVITNSRSLLILKNSKASALISKNIAERSLLPNLDFFVGYQALGQDYNLRDREHTIYGGISSKINIGRQKEKADLNIKKIDLKKRNLEMLKKIFDLNIYIKEALSTIRKQIERISFARKKVILAGKILRAERDNYNIGRKKLDDLIPAKKTLENARYDLIRAEITYQGLVLEWLKVTDQLVKKRDAIPLLIKGMQMPSPEK